MLKKFSKWISDLSKGWVTLIALLIFLLFTAIVLPGQSAKVASYSGSSGSPDLSVYYSADDLYKMAETYGVEGRRAYIQARFSFDLLFPIIYLVFLCTSISWVNRRILKPESAWQLINLLPIAAFLFDLLENSAAALVISRFPTRTPVLASLAGFFTLLKWLFIGGSFVVLVIGLVLWLVRRPGTKGSNL
jgi:hypothetical protein